MVISLLVNMSLQVGVGTRGCFFGKVFRNKGPVFFSLTYNPNNTKTPKKLKFKALKKSAPQKNKMLNRGLHKASKLILHQV